MQEPRGNEEQEATCERARAFTMAYVPPVTLDDVLGAAARLEGVAHRTPVLRSHAVDELVGAERGMALVPPYDHPHVISGKGSTVWPYPSRAS
ncbi:hypothetical protein ACQPZA_15080 [Pseudonocardia xinjiangensis]|uniref:hypothetical protein n=1 Tax=Pseudonocardia xinjiangensis TaxID=75289 RepID=UPI003D8A1CBF